jgi:hypothetical protein
MRWKLGIFGFGLLALSVLVGTAALVARAFRPADVWLMPGELGHVRPDASLFRDRAQSAAAAPEPRREIGSEWRGHSPATDEATAHAGFMTRAIGLRTAEEQAWGRQNGLTEALAFSHHLAAVFTPKLAKIHPEYFPLIGGKRLQPAPDSGYWNPDLGRQDTASYAAARAAGYFDAHPQAKAYSLGINDGWMFGESPETLALVSPQRWFRGRPDYSRLVFTFMNRAAAVLRRTHPDKYLGCLAYYWCENVPPFSVDRQVIPFLTADRSQSYDPAFKREEFALQARWARAMGIDRSDPTERSETRSPQPRLGMYDYLDGYGFLVPRVPIHAFAEHIRHAYDVGFTDYYGESSRNWGIDGPMPWVIAQLLQHPHADVERLLGFYYRAYFGAAAGPMRQFFTRCEQQWMDQPGPSYWLKYYRSEAQAALFPPEVCRELRVMLTTAAAQADTELVRQRVAFVADSFGVTERFVALQTARSVLGNALLRHAVPTDELSRMLAEYLQRRSDFIRYTHATTLRWPLAFYPINFNDYLRDDPTYATTLALIQAGHRDLAGMSPNIGLTDGTAAAGALRDNRARPILPNGSFEGPLKPGLRIGGLPYDPDLPHPWHGQIEPTQSSQVTIEEGSSNTMGQPRGRVLRVSGAEDATVFQWLPAKPGALYLASVRTRGLVSSSDAVALTVGWLDRKQQHIGTVVAMRLPDGSWPDWVSLDQGARAPAGAAWVGIGIRVMHQVKGDWAEFADFSLREVLGD